MNFLDHIKNTGAEKGDRTGVGTISVFGYQMRFPFSDGFPLVTTKRIHIKSFVHELLWMLRGETSIKYLQDNGIRIWNEWADENGELGPVYGKQWRAWKTSENKTVDQITNVIDQIKTNPNSRRLLVSSWNVGELEQMSLPPCPMIFQFYVVDNEISCLVYQRTADAFFGVPFNIAVYSLLTFMIAQQCDLRAKELVWMGGDCHIYNNLRELVDLQLTRSPYPLPTLQIKRRPDSIFDYKFEDFEFVNYQHHPTIKGKIAV